MYLNASNRLAHANAQVRDQRWTIDNIPMPSLRALWLAHRPRAVVGNLLEQGGAIEVVDARVRQGLVECQVIRVKGAGQGVAYEFWVDPGNQFDIVRMIKRLNGQDVQQIDLEYTSGQLSGATTHSLLSESLPRSTRTLAEFRYDHRQRSQDFRIDFPPHARVAYDVGGRQWHELPELARSSSPWRVWLIVLGTVSVLVIAWAVCRTYLRKEQYDK